MPGQLATNDKAMERIPVVDLGPLTRSLSENSEPNGPSEDEKYSRFILAEEITNAFKEIGFVYIVNHGIDKNLFENVQDFATKFFSLPSEVKVKYKRPTDGSNHGWDGTFTERLDPRRTKDFKEAFNVTLCTAKVWPDEEVPGFKEALQELYEKERQLSQIILRLIGLGLGLKDPDYFAKCHNATTRRSYTNLRLLHYPPIPDDIGLTPGTVRCGEHSDYGAMTILWQDQGGGLEVRNRNGDFIKATPLEGSLVVNIGDLMQRWTADTLISTRHRVLMPTDEIACRRMRRSMAFFVQPDYDTLITCVDGSDKYPSITAGDYSNRRFAETYGSHTNKI